MERGYVMPARPAALASGALALAALGAVLYCALPSASTATTLRALDHAATPPFAMWAIDYGVSRFPEAAIFAGVDSADGATADFGWLFYAIRHGGSWALVDAGFDDAYLRSPAEWNLSAFADPLSLLLDELGVRAADVTTLVLTHHHADHAGNILRFPNARLLTHRLVAEELRKAGCANDGGGRCVRSPPAGAIERLEAAGRLRTFDGRWSDPIALGGGFRLRVESVGGHAPGSSMVWVDGPGGPGAWSPSTARADAPPLALLAGDEVYLPQNVRQGRPTGTSVNATRSAAVVGEIRDAAARGTRVFYFHDPRELGGRLGARRVL